MANRRTSIPGFVATAAFERETSTSYGAALGATAIGGVTPAFCDSRECRRHCLRDVCDPDWGGIARCSNGKCQCLCF